MNTIQNYGMTNYGLGFRAQGFATASQLPKWWYTSKQMEQMRFALENGANKIVNAASKNESIYKEPMYSAEVRRFVSRIDLDPDGIESLNRNCKEPEVEGFGGLMA